MRFYVFARTAELPLHAWRPRLGSMSPIILSGFLCLESDHPIHAIVRFVEEVLICPRSPDQVLQ